MSLMKIHTKIEEQHMSHFSYVWNKIWHGIDKLVIWEPI